MFDHLDIGPSSYPWEIYHDRPSLDLALPEYKRGRALILYPEGYAATQEEAEFTYSGGLVDWLTKTRSSFLFMIR